VAAEVLLQEFEVREEDGTNGQVQIGVQFLLHKRIGSRDSVEWLTLSGFRLYFFLSTSLLFFICIVVVVGFFLIMRVFRYFLWGCMA